MMSLLTKGKNISALAGRLLRSEFFTVSQRTLLTKNCLPSCCVHKQNSKTFEIKKYVHSSQNDPKDFGEIVDLEEDFNTLTTNDQEPRRKKKKIGRTVKGFNEKSNENPESENLKNKTVETKSYEEIDKNVKTLSYLMVQLKSGKLGKKNKIFVEGKRLIKDACAAGFIPDIIFFTRASDLEELGLPKQTKLLRVSYKSCQLWSDSDTSQGIIGIFTKPNMMNLNTDSDSIPLTVVCDNVRDPGNLGSIIRVVASAGCKKLLLTQGCTNIWGPKVLRAGAGAHFHFPILTNLHWPDIKKETEDSEVFIADGNYKKDLRNNSDEGSKKFREINELSDSLPMLSCFSVDFKNRDTVLIIGGETHGISIEAYKYAQSRNGTRVFIPVSNKIDSLNTSVALGILTYEFRRQFCCLTQEDSQLLKEI